MREDNIWVFQDTEKMCKETPELKTAIAEAVKQQKLIYEYEELPKKNKNVYEENAAVVVSKKRTLEAAGGYKGQKVCILNFASATNPGGGVVNGSNAQEECLCRCSTLYFCLNTKDMWGGFYAPHRAEKNPLHNDDIIYTPEVTVFKTDTQRPEKMKPQDWYPVNVITCAAPNLREKPGNRYNCGDGDISVKITDDKLQQLHEKRLRRILDVALFEGNEVVILGAFGCGAFQNSSEVVAAAAKNVLSEYEHAFRTIEFAVYCNAYDLGNYEVFRRRLL